MSIAGTAVPIGDIRLHFAYFLDDGPPHAWLDIVSDAENNAFGGLAINCLNIGDVPDQCGIDGNTYTFGAADEDAGAALSESVFWKPGDHTLELTALELRFGKLQGTHLPITVKASCFDHSGNHDIAVLIVGMARVVSK